MVAMVSVFGLVACVPLGMSDKIYDFGIKAINVTDKYLDADLTLDEAHTEIRDIENQVFEIFGGSSEKDYAAYNLIACLGIEFENMLPYSDGAFKGTDEEALRLRNSLAEELGVKKR